MINNYNMLLKFKIKRKKDKDNNTSGVLWNQLEKNFHPYSDKMIMFLIKVPMKRKLSLSHLKELLK